MTDMDSASGSCSQGSDQLWQKLSIKITLSSLIIIMNVCGTQEQIGCIAQHSAAVSGNEDTCREYNITNATLIVSSQGLDRNVTHCQNSMNVDAFFHQLKQKMCTNSSIQIILRDVHCDCKSNI